MRQIVALPAASLVFLPIRWVSGSYCALPVTLANGRTATVGTPERAARAGAEDATTAAGLPAVKYHAADAAPATVMSAATAATGISRTRGAGFGLGATAGLPTATE